MHDDHDEELSAAQREALGSLPRETPPPPALEERVVAALRTRGAVRDGGGRRWPKIAALAASLAALVALAYFVGAQAGAARGGAGTAAGAGERPTFALLIYDPVGAPPPADLQAIVAEASAWAGGLAEEGIFVTGEKLGESGFQLAMRGESPQVVAQFPAPGASQALGGFFLIRADDYEHAGRIAASCPLLRHGSTVEVRALEIR